MLVACLSVVLGSVTNFLALSWLASHIQADSAAQSSAVTFSFWVAWLIGTGASGVLGWRWARRFFERFK